MKTSITNVEFAEEIIRYATIAKDFYIKANKEDNLDAKYHLINSCTGFLKQTRDLVSAMFFVSMITGSEFSILFKAVNKEFSDDYIQNLIQAFKECGIDV